MSKPWNPRLVPIRRARRPAGRPAAWDLYRARPRRRRGRIGSRDLRLMVLGGIVLGLAVTIFAEPADPGTDAGAVTAGAAVRVIDGDTFYYGGERIRIADIDTPEVNGRCPYEAELAVQATARLETLLAGGGFALEAVERDEDKYGRKLRIVTRGGESVGDTLVAEGLARPWTGRRKSWCG